MGYRVEVYNIAVSVLCHLIENTYAYICMNTYGHKICIYTVYLYVHIKKRIKSMFYIGQERPNVLQKFPSDLYTNEKGIPFYINVVPNSLICQRLVILDNFILSFNFFYLHPSLKMGIKD